MTKAGGGETHTTGPFQCHFCASPDHRGGDCKILCSSCKGRACPKALDKKEKCTNSWPSCPDCKTNPIPNALGSHFGKSQTDKQASAWNAARPQPSTTPSRDGPIDPRFLLGGVPNAKKTKTNYSLYGGLQDSGDFFGFRAIDDGGTDDGFLTDIDKYDRAHNPTTTSTSDCSASSSGRGVEYIPFMIDNRTNHTLPPAM